MWFERRSLPSRRDVIMRVMAAVLLAWILYAFPGHLWFSNAGEALSRLFDTGAAVGVLKEFGIVVLVAATGAHVERFRGRRQSDAAMAVLAYVAARALTGGLFHPSSLDSWSPYPMWHWLRGADFLLPGIFLQALLLRPLWPVFVRDVGEIRSRAAAILCVLPFLLWEWLSGSVGSAAAALICALALVLVMVLAGRQRFVLFALVSCAGFLTASAFIQQEPPRGVLDAFYSSAPGIDLQITLPKADGLLDASGLSTRVDVYPGVSTLFGCPTQVHVSLSLIAPQPSNPKDMPRYNKLLAGLARSPYTLAVSGVTRITDIKKTANGRSQVIYAPASRGGAYTVWDATGFDVDPGRGDVLDFSLPLQSWRSMGTCYVTIPQVRPDWVDATYPQWPQPASATVGLFPGTGTSVDLTDTSPRPADQPVVRGYYDWTCFDYSHPGSGKVSSQCPAIAVMVAGWSASYPQVALLVVGALIAIAAEHWFRAIHPEKPGKTKAAGHGGDEDADPPPGDGHTSGTDVVAPDSPGT
jgi:hypothetical protein